MIEEKDIYEKVKAEVKIEPWYSKKTFDGIVDESFDNEPDDSKRLQMITDEIVKLLNSNLDSFVEQCKDVCKYNQQHYKQMRNTVRAQFPDQFFNFLRQYT